MAIKKSSLYTEIAIFGTLFSKICFAMFYPKMPFNIMKY